MAGLNINNPLKLKNVLSSEYVLPGDVIKLRGGTYVGDWIIDVAGTSEKPVIFMPFKDEVVTFEGSITPKGAHTEWRNIIIHQPAEDISAINMNVVGTKFTDCDISGGKIAVQWFGSGTGALLRCNIHNSKAYGVYTHNNGGGLRELTNCVFSNTGGYYALHMYSEANNWVKDYLISGCDFDKGVVVHSGTGVSNIQFSANTFRSGLRFGNGQTVSDMRQGVISGNTFNGSASGLAAISWSDLEVTNNNFSITKLVNQQTNITLFRGANEKRTVIDNNKFLKGTFDFENSSKTFAQWQTLGYDTHSDYNP